MTYDKTHCLIYLTPKMYHDIFISVFMKMLNVFNHFPSNPRLVLVQGCVNHDYSADGTIVEINLNVRLFCAFSERYQIPCILYFSFGLPVS